MVTLERIPKSETEEGEDAFPATSDREVRNFSELRNTVVQMPCRYLSKHVTESNVIITPS
jgi:hypothetical protein